MMDSEKQGNIGDLTKKTTKEINEMILRQNKLLQNVPFINKLPDKGERIRGLVQRLETELESRKGIDSTADLFHQMALDAEKANRSRGTRVNEMDEEESNDPLENIVNRASDEKQIQDNRIHPEHHYINSYERVINKANKPAPKKKFFPHKTTKPHDTNVSNETDTKVIHKDIVNIDSETNSFAPSSSISVVKNINGNHSTLQPENNDTQPGTLIGQKSENPKLKHRYDDSLEMSTYIPSRKHEGTKIISIGDSMELFEAQKKKTDMIQAQQAGKRLAEKLGVKMVDFEPKQFEMRYRDKGNDSGGESADTDGEEVDYPD